MAPELTIKPIQVASMVQFSLLLVSLSAGLGKTFETLTADDYARMASVHLPALFYAP